MSKRHLGYAMMAAPFVVLLAMAVSDLGLLQAAAVFGGTAALVIWIWAAVELVIS